MPCLFKKYIFYKPLNVAEILNPTCYFARPHISPEQKYITIVDHVIV